MALNSKKWTRLITFVAIPVAACCIAYYFGLLMARERPLPFVTVDSADLDFGEVWETSTFRWPLKLRNNTADPVVIRGWQSSCGCAVVQARVTELAGYQEITVPVVLDLTHERFESMSGQRISVAVTAEVRDKLSGPPQRLSWTLRGGIRKALTLAPKVLNVRDDLVLGEPASKQIVKVTSPVPLKGLIIRSDRKWGEINWQPTGTNQQDFVVEMYLVANAPSGAFSFDVSIEGDRGDATLPAKVLKVMGVVKDSVRAVPSPVHLGIRTIGETVEEVVTLSALSSKSFKIDGVETTTPSLSFHVQPGPTAMPNTFVLKQAIEKLGPQSNEAVFRLSLLPSGDPVTVVVPVTYHGRQGNGSPQKKVIKP